MSHPKPSAEQIETFRREGYLVVRDALVPEDLTRLSAICDDLLANKEKVAFDWAWEAGDDRENRKFKIVQTSPSLFHGEALATERFRVWSTEFASALLGRDVEFWYDQFLAKPPGKSVPTYWHQDEGYWGRNLDNRGITCWMPLHDVDETNGCMHFIDGGHHDGVIEHQLVPGVQSDLLYCEPDDSRAVVCPLRKGGVTFHHSRTPHMTTANTSGTWRRALTQHLRVVGVEGEGDHYPWKVYVNQFTGQRTTPPTR